MLNNWYDISVNFFLSMAYNIWIKLQQVKKILCEYLLEKGWWIALAPCQLPSYTAINGPNIMWNLTVLLSQAYTPLWTGNWLNFLPEEVERGGISVANGYIALWDWRKTCQLRFLPRGVCSTCEQLRRFDSWKATSR